jgi:hypothetical protein
VVRTVPLVKLPLVVRENRIIALFTSLPKKYIQKMENLRQMLEKMEIFYEEMP